MTFPPPTDIYELALRVRARGFDADATVKLGEIAAQSDALITSIELSRVADAQDLWSQRARRCGDQPFGYADSLNVIVHMAMLSQPIAVQSDDEALTEIVSTRVAKTCDFAFAERMMLFWGTVAEAIEKGRRP
jgi:hypothetical protein